LADSLTNLFDDVRNGAASVAARARSVRIAEDKIAAYAEKLPLDQVQSPEIDGDHHYLGRGDDTAAFFLTLNSINFGSGYFPHLAKRPGMSGYFTVASSLNDRFRSSGPWTSDELMALDSSLCAETFHQDLSSPPVRELMEFFSSALNDLGRFVTTHHRGSFSDVVRSANGSAESLARSLIRMPFFNDVEHYGDLDVPFYKRAQIVASDLAVAFQGNGLGRFDDLDRQTIFADNLVPHVLRIDGILEFDSELIEQIEREALISIGSPEEIEIRACAVHTVERIVTHLQSRGKAVSSRLLDHYLWNRGQDPHYKARPRHRCRCVYY